MKQHIRLTWKKLMKSSHNLLRHLSNTRSGPDVPRRKGREPVPMLSGASKCVWQMDREA